MQKAIFRDRVEVTFQVSIDHKDMTGFQQTFDNAQCIMATAATAEAEASIVKCVIEDRFDDIDKRRLHDTVSNGWYPQGSRLTASWFGNLDSSHSLRHGMSA